MVKIWPRVIKGSSTGQAPIQVRRANIEIKDQKKILLRG
jgi:hypothetical protein